MRRDRSGTTLVEMLVAMALWSVIGTALALAVAGAWRSHDALADAHMARQAVSDAADLLRAELRPASPAAGDLVAISDTAVELRATLGASVVCAVSASRDRVMLPPRSPAAGAPLTWWRDMPAPGDSVDVLDPRGALPDTVSRHGLTSMASGTCPVGSGFVRSAGDAARSIEAGLAPPLPASIGPGAPLRFLRRTRYSLYRSATDGRWYLGIRELTASGWSVIQPVTGPFVPASGGMAIRLSDSAGAAVAAAPYDAVRAIDLALRSSGRRPARALGRAAAAAESAHVIISPRNQ